MGLYEVNYTYRLLALPNYVLEIVSKGACPSLVKASFYETEGNLILRFNTNGLIPMNKVLAGRGDANQFPKLLGVLRSCTESLALAEEYLVKPELISFTMKDIFFNEEGKARLIVKPSGKTPMEALMSLCAEIGREMPFFNADIVQRKLQDYANKGRINCGSLLKLLSSMSLTPAA